MWRNHALCRQSIVHLVIIVAASRAVTKIRSIFLGHGRPRNGKQLTLTFCYSSSCNRRIWNGWFPGIIMELHKCQTSFPSSIRPKFLCVSFSSCFFLLMKVRGRTLASSEYLSQCSHRLFQGKEWREAENNRSVGDIMLALYRVPFEILNSTLQVQLVSVCLLRSIFFSYIYRKAGCFFCLHRFCLPWHHKSC
jgi:hypothetical protein